MLTGSVGGEITKILQTYFLNHVKLASVPYFTNTGAQQIYDSLKWERVHGVMHKVQLYFSSNMNMIQERCDICAILSVLTH